MYTTRVTEKKRGRVEEIKKILEEGKGYIFADYRGLTVEQITRLRNELRQQQAILKVVKNRFAKLAFSELEITGLDEVLLGPTVVAVAKEDPAVVAKTIFKYVNETPIKVKAGYIDGQLYGAQQVEAISKLPSRAELLATLMGTMNAPLQNLVYALNGVTTKLVRTLKALADKMEQG